MVSSGLANGCGTNNYSAKLEAGDLLARRLNLC
jgi:hypothetical protein